MERCPVCRARLREEVQLCRRCGSDISLLYEIERQAEQLIAAAVQAWAAADPQSAVRLARRSLSLKDNAGVRVILRFLEQSEGTID
ncbi:MAG TPA: hypothetical protein ENK33_03725 [Desulfobacterales bacterium]|nr:hypothetical protein [Desulfobacterales bacterium]